MDKERARRLFLTAFFLFALANGLSGTIISNYFKSLPPALEESAKIDGATDLRILWSVILPLSLPLLARYNGQRGKNARVNNFLKWFFYLYYPLHLTILGAVRYFG